jgi:nucleotide-binding universal stress UspA family protein
MRLLLAVDFTTSVEDVVAAVSSRPWPSGTLAHVLTAIEYAATPSKIWRDAAGRIEPVKEALLGLADDVTGHAVERLEEAGVRAEAVIKVDDPRFVIVREADEWVADLIFIRSHTYTDITRWLLGSVAKAVLRDAPCSVEIVRVSASDARRLARTGMKILLATDGSEYSLAAALSVRERPWPPGTEAKVISVVEPWVHLLEREHGRLEKSGNGPNLAKASIREAEDIIRSSGLKTTGELMTGDPKEEITNLAKEWGAHLVVVGSHGRRKLKRLLLGSVSEAVATHAPCSVEVIRKSAGSSAS